MIRLIGNQFKKPTGLFGKVISRKMIKGNKPEYDIIIPELDIKPNDRLLEIGYGPGLGVNRIASDYDCFISGIDFSYLMYKEATKRNKKHIEKKKVELHYGDFLKSELTANEYDKVFCLNVIYFWDKLDIPFTKINKTLKEGGLFCMFMVDINFLNKFKFTKDDIFNKYTIEQVINELKSAGFNDINYKFDIGYIIKCRK
jgi:cyclopropane fatty-acyl-phospholipid synthase-like methyltransferase